MNRRREKNVMLAAAALLFAASGFLQPFAAWLGRPKYPHETGGRPFPGLKAVPEGTLKELANFATHLPIVILEFDGEPRKHASWNSRKQYAEPVEGDPFADGVFRLLNSEAGVNRLSDAPQIVSHIRSRYRGMTSLNFPKKQYLLKMFDDDGGERRVDLLGMGEGGEWILNISHIDKSLLRNYLCLNVASRIMGYAPETRYCEAFRKRGERYEYLGVYLLMEPVDRGDDRVKLTKYNPHHAASAYLLRRDRFQEDSTILDTYATVRRLSAGFLEVKYPGRKKITPRTVAFIEEDVSRFERAIYSDDEAEFLAYREMIDMTSFADYFIINEFFANYDSQWNSYFMHRELLQPLKLGPVWDFDQAMGNNAPFVFNPEATAMQNAVWLDRLLRDGKFQRHLAARYHELRRGVLSEKNLYRFIDDVVAYLGDARQRDWSRWRYDNPRALEYDAGDVIHPNLQIIRTYAEEIDAMKKTLRAHGDWLDRNIDVVYGGFVQYN